MTAYSKQLIIFDLDGTLTKSKAPLEHDMADLLIRLLTLKKKTVMSGGGFSQFETQFLRSMPANSESFSNLLLLPTSGTRLYTWRGLWREEYAEHLDASAKTRIMESLNSALKAAGYEKPAQTFGPLIEDRGSQ